MTHTIPQDKKNWLLNTAWKKLTIKQIAAESNINVSLISKFYKENNIEPVKRRDVIASGLIDLINTGNHECKSVSDLALIFNCSTTLIKGIIDEYKLQFNIRKYKNGSEKISNINENRLQAAKARDEHILNMRKERANHAVYTQSGSQLIDDCRGLKTTLRLKTYLTNANL